MGPLEYGMVANFSGTTGVYNLVSILGKHTLSNPRHMRGFLQPATYEEAIDDLTIGNIITTEPYGQNRVIFDRASSSVSRHILNSLSFLEEEE
jgi:hypothetical protein